MFVFFFFFLIWRSPRSTLSSSSAASDVYKRQNMTWDEFKAQNANPVQVNVDNDWMNMFSSATGISTNNITVLAYNVPYFYDAPKTSVLSRASFWIQIGLAVAILGILVFIVLRSARPLTVEEKEPELSVEEMLASTKENQPSVDDIDLQEKSETRKAIEKFVDENPVSYTHLTLPTKRIV